LKQNGFCLLLFNKNMFGCWIRPIWVKGTVNYSKNDSNTRWKKLFKQNALRPRNLSKPNRMYCTHFSIGGPNILWPFSPFTIFFNWAKFELSFFKHFCGYRHCCWNLVKVHSKIRFVEQKLVVLPNFRTTVFLPNISRHFFI